MSNIIDLQGFRLKKTLFTTKKEEHTYKNTMKNYGFSKDTTTFLSDTMDLMITKGYKLEDKDVENIIMLCLLFQEILDNIDNSKQSTTLIDAIKEKIDL